MVLTGPLGIFSLMSIYMCKWSSQNLRPTSPLRAVCVRERSQTSSAQRPYMGRWCSWNSKDCMCERSRETSILYHVHNFIFYIQSILWIFFTDHEDPCIQFGVTSPRKSIACHYVFIWSIHYSFATCHIYLEFQGNPMKSVEVWKS